MEPTEPQLPRFYADRVVLITGATGFIGKVLVERLLSTCPAVGRLHLLMRARRGRSPEERLAHLKESQLFDNLRAQSPAQLDKLVAVSGDVTEPQLGLDASAIASLKEVTVVFHSAATIKLREPLREAVSQNVLSAVYVMDVCDMLPALQALVHVSTAYTSTELANTEERVYEMPLKLPALLKLMDETSPQELHQNTPKLIRPHLNTYTFTKALAEVAVAQRQHRSYSVTIFRPTIVISSHRAPFPGWVEGVAGIVGVVVGAGQGLLKVFHSKKECRADLVPVDVVADNMIAVGWDTATARASEARVYYCGSVERPVCWGEFRDQLCTAAVRRPSRRALYYPFVITHRNRYLYKALEMLIQTAPLYLVEFISRLCGVTRNINLIVVAQRLSALSELLGGFACRQWSFRCDNMRRLRAKLRASDALLFQLDVRDVDWPEHMSNFHRGALKYVLLQDESSPRATAHMNRLRVLHYAVTVLVTLSSVKIFVCVVQCILNWLNEYFIKVFFVID